MYRIWASLGGGTSEPVPESESPHPVVSLGTKHSRHLFQHVLFCLHVSAFLPLKPSTPLPSSLFVFKQKIVSLKVRGFAFS